MKQAKQERAEHRQDVLGDTRPTKPLPGETAHHLATMPARSGPAKGDGPPAEQADGGRKAKPASDGGAALEPEGDRPDQVPRTAGEGGQPVQQYVRMRVRVRGDRLSIVDSHLVDGPLSQSTTFHGTAVYDVTHQDRLLHAGSVPDLGMQRSFPNPDGPEGQQGHRMTPQTTSDFSVRVPAHELTPDTIGAIRVTLHQVQEATTAPRLTAAPLAVQLEGRITPTAQLEGLPDSVLPEAIQGRGARTAQGPTAPA